MTVNEMRIYILQSYPNSTTRWREKVTKMPTAQVIAFYKSLVNREDKKKPEQIDDGYHQIDIFEYMASIQDAGSHTQIAL